MEQSAIESAIGPALAAAFSRKGYSELTPVQQAVLDPTLRDRDLRITSQTGSGKTLAIGFALRSCVTPTVGATAARPAPPQALIVAPTRELARQTQAELEWLYADVPAHALAIVGGSSFRDERRALARSPGVIVGTPGRLLDHLSRGSIEPSALAAVVLDEADRLLDMGFREDLDAILKYAPAGHRTHLVSATFPPVVRALADRVQKEPAHVQGTRLGAANLDIDHVIHVIDPREKLDAIINLLLATPEAQTLVFARTRADVASLASDLVRAGFSATALSGELEQAARTRALAAFKAGRESVLVATDVAARGIDVQDITRVIHAEPPTSADAYTHRSGRTGRAGRKGTSVLLLSMAQVVPVTRLLRAAGIAHRFEPVPSAQSIRDAQDERLLAQLTREPAAGETLEDARSVALARKLLTDQSAERIVARLLLRARTTGTAEPREIRTEPRPNQRPARGRGDAGHAPPRRGPRQQSYVPFRVTWGGEHGADARRLLAIACRRGQIQGSDVGAIHIEADHSIVEVSSRVAEAFALHAARPDRRDTRVRISRLRDDARPWHDPNRARHGGEPHRPTRHRP